MPYTDIPITTDTTALYQAAVDYIQAQPGFEDWEPDESKFSSIILGAIASMAYEQAYVAAQRPSDIFRFFGTDIVGVLAQAATNAIGATTWTLSDTLGHTIPAGTQVAADDVAFETSADVVVAPGSSTTTTGGVPIVAVDAGTAANGLSGTVTPIDSLDWVSNITLVGSTSGGVDAETPQAYEDRLADQSQLWAYTLVVPRDYEILAEAQPGIERAVALDNYNPYTNLLTANEASLETNTTGWNNGSNTNIARSTSAASDGAASLSLTAVAGGAISAETFKVAVSPGQVHNARAEFKAAATARSVRVDISWWDAANLFISGTTGTTATDATGSFTEAFVDGTAPSNATQASVVVTVLGAAASEVHYVDKIGLRLGTHATNPTWMAGGADPTINERTVTVAVMDENGAVVPSQTKADLDTLLQTYREINFIVYVIDPTYTNLTIAYSIHPQGGYNSAAALVNAQAAVSNYLSAASWGRPTVGSGTDRSWVNTPIVRLNKMIQQIENAEGVDYASSVTINGAAADYTLKGAVPLPGSLTINGVLI